MQNVKIVYKKKMWCTKNEIKFFCVKMKLSFSLTRDYAFVAGWQLKYITMT